jgi:hypothetical protein
VHAFLIFILIINTNLSYLLINSILLIKKNQHKFDFRSKECVFLGYSRNHKGYKCFYIPTARVYISRDVVFHEKSFPFSSHSSTSTPNLQASFTLLSSSLTLPPYLVSSPPATISPSPSPPLSPAASSVSSDSLESSFVSSSPHPCPAPTRLHPMVTRAQNQIVQPRIFTDGRVKYPISRALLVVQDLAITEPTCYSNAVKIPEWR